MMSAYMTVWKARFLDVDKKSSVTLLMSPLATRSGPWDQQLWKPAGCQQLKTWRVEPADDRIDPPPEREAPSRPYREASLCDVVMFFSLSRVVSCLESPVSVSSQSRRSLIASAMSLVLATLLSVRWLAEESDLLTEWIRCSPTYCASGPVLGRL